MLGEGVNRGTFTRGAAGADLSIVEGMMGLFDGSSAVHDVGSTAELAKQLRAPVVLVIDASAMARSVAAMASGYARFDPNLDVRAVVFNRVTSEGHYRLLRDAVEADTDLTVVGYLRPDAALTIPDRHLGLRTAIEQDGSHLYDQLARSAGETIDLTRIEALARSAGTFPEPPRGPVPMSLRSSVRMAVAYDAAFCFYYGDNLALLESAGAEIVRFSPMRDAQLPEADLLYFGGGYPELYGEVLAGNRSMRMAVKHHAEHHGAIYAECGGLMYLTQAIRDAEGRSHEMVGLFAAESVMRKTGMTLGYRTVELAHSCLLGPAGLSVRGHEFHYSLLEPKGRLHYACQLFDAEGRVVGQDGLMVKNTLAMYSHLHFASRPEAALSLLRHARGSHRPASHSMDR